LHEEAAWYDRLRTEEPLSDRTRLGRALPDDALSLRVPCVELPPGQLIVSATPCTVGTVLGRGVSVGLWDRTRRIGGINHFLIPGGDTDDSARSGTAAMQLLVAGVLSLGAHAKDLRAHLIGGARLEGALESDSLGEMNVDFAVSWLESAGLELGAFDVGGSCSRRISFCLGTGRMRCDRAGGCR
jgi:chemotaxis protein CheD